MHIGSMIRYYRHENDYTQEELAFNICSPTYLSQIETGKIQPNEDILRLIGGKMNIDFMKVYKNEDELRKKLFRWYHAIIDRKDREAEKLLYKIKDDIEKSTSVELRIYFSLFELRYFLYQNKRDYAYQALKELDTYKKVFNANQMYYYEHFKAIYLLQEGKLQESIEYFEGALDISEKLNINEADLYYRLSIAYSRVQKLTRSNILVNKALDIYGNEHKYHRIVDCNMILGINYSKLKEYQYAESNFKDVLNAIPRFKGVPEEKIKGKVYHNLGFIYYIQNKSGDAITYLEMSLEFRKTDLDKLRTYYILAQIYSTEQNLEKRNKIIHEALEIATNNCNKEYLFKLQVLQYDKEERNDHQKFISYFENEIIPYFEEYGDLNDFCEMMKKLGDLYFEERRYKKAAMLYLKLDSIKEV